LNTLVQGAWVLLLSQYTGEKDVIFGCVVSGRPADLAEVDSMVGLFINTLPVRVTLPPKADLVSWLRQLQAQQIDLRRYEYSPLTLVQQWGAVSRGGRLFETLLVFENYPIDRAISNSVAGLTASELRVVERQNYPLMVVVLPGSSLEL